MSLRVTTRWRAGFALVCIAMMAGCGGGGDTTGISANSVAKVGGIRLDSTSISVVVGVDHRLTATVTDANGAPLAGQPVSWNSVNATVASVTQDGIVHGVASGATTVTAVSGSYLAKATISVAPAQP